MGGGVNTVEPGIDPIVLQIVEGTLASVEAEVEAAIERTSRSPMIREARDFRAGIHDRRCRKLTGRSYSALVQPVVRDFPLSTMRPGDVYFHNDVYGSEGGIGHLPDLCVTLPVFHDEQVVAFVQVFGHHDDIGGAVPGSMPSHATSAYQEGLIVPPVKLYDAGQPNTDVIKIMVRNSRLPDSLRGALDRGCGLPARRGAPHRSLPPIWARTGRGVLRRDPRAHRGDLPTRAAEQDPGGHLRVGGLRGARRRGSTEAP